MIPPFEPFKITPDMLELNTQETLAEILRQDMKRRNAACFDDLATVINVHFPELTCTGRILQDRITKMVEAEDRLHKSDCETCGKERACYHNHGRHGVVRINCPLWRAKG